MAMAAEGSALHVGVIRLHFCRTRRPRAAGSLLSDPAVLAPPGCCDAVGPCCRTPLAPAGPLLSDPAVGLWLVGPRFRSLPSDFLLSDSHTLLSDTVGVAFRIRFRVLFCFWVAPYNKRCNACE